MHSKTSAQSFSIEKKLLDENFLNLPNCLSFCRLLFLPVFIYFAKKYYLSNYNLKLYFLSLFFLSIIYLTDYLDGKLARLLHKETIFGKYLDPICDKFVALTSFLLLVRFFGLPFWLLLFSLFREILGSYLGYYLFYKRGIQASPNLYGKWGVVLGVVIIIYYLTLPVVSQKFFLSQAKDMPCFVFVFLNLVGIFKYYKQYFKSARRGT